MQWIHKIFNLALLIIRSEGTNQWQPGFGTLQPKPSCPGGNMWCLVTLISRKQLYIVLCCRVSFTGMWWLFSTRPETLETRDRPYQSEQPVSHSVMRRMRLRQSVVCRLIYKAISPCSDSLYLLFLLTLYLASMKKTKQPKTLQKLLRCRDLLHFSIPGLKIMLWDPKHFSHYLMLLRCMQNPCQQKKLADLAKS